jgi:hypothetical protein
MAKVKAFYDNEGNTLTVWFGDPQTEVVCEEASEGIILMKNTQGKVIGFEKLDYVEAAVDKKITFETTVL